MKYKPLMYYKDIYNINYKLLKKRQIKFLLFDIDNTILPVDKKEPSKELISLIQELKKDFHIIIISNALPHRVKYIKNTLQIDGYSFSLKPFTINYRKIMRKYNATPKQIAAIGDQLYTDIKAANKLTITSILVDPISKNEFIITRLNRLKENKLINKTKIITRGEYYE